MECQAVCCKPGKALPSEPSTSSALPTDLALLEQQVLAAPKVKLLDQAEWYRGLPWHPRYQELEPCQRQASYKWQHLLVREDDVKHGELPLVLPTIPFPGDMALSKQVVQHDLLVRPTESGYQAIMVDVNADFPEGTLYCAAPLFGIGVAPLGNIQPALLPLYLVWWLNVHQTLCENPEALIQSEIPLPPVALQRALLALLVRGG